MKLLKLSIIATLLAGGGSKAQDANALWYYYKHKNLTVTLTYEQWVELLVIMKSSPTLKYQKIKFEDVIIEQMRKQLFDTTIHHTDTLTR